MSIMPFLDGQRLDPETNRIASLAFEMTRMALGLAHADLATEIVAKKIIELTRAGERDPDLICERALNGLYVASPRVSD